MNRFLCVGFLAFVAGCGAPPVSVQAPGKIAQALEVVGDLGATAVLVPKGKDPLAAVQLERGDDDVTFTGFLPADPGSYTLEITFSGVPDAAVGGGDRHFLGRLTSDAFTVSRGATATPEFNSAVDLLGRSGDGGDEDDDGLAFLDELFVGTDPQSADSDSDTVLDGDDCSPTSPADAFVILDGGSVEDCDGDAFRAVNSPIGDPGNDCNDRDALIHPGADDDCGTVIDQDCNPSTCPVDDSDGPTINIISPGDGATLGCHARATAGITDPSTVQNAFVQLPDSPFSGGTPRTITMVQDATDEELWRSLDVTIGGNITLASQPLVVRATDGVGNTGTAEINVDFAFSFPAVTWTGPHTISDAAVNITLTPAGARPLVALELRASPLGQSNLVDGSQFEVVETLPVSGGTANVAPAELTDGVVVWVYAEDDIGNKSNIIANSFFDVGAGTIRADWPCDPFASHGVQAAAYVSGNGAMTLLENINEAMTIMEGIAPDHNLVKIIAFGMGADGRFDPSVPGFGRFLCYYFNEPHVPPQDPNDDNEGKSVCYNGISSGITNPEVRDPDGSLFSDVPIPNLGSLLDSPALVGAWPCVADQFDGSSNDYVMILPNDDASETHAFLYTDDASWGVDAFTGAEWFACDPG